MQLPVTALYAGQSAMFALYPSFQAGDFRGKAGISVRYGDPVTTKPAKRLPGRELPDALAQPSYGIFGSVAPGVAETQADEVRVARAGRKNMSGRDADSCTYRIVEEPLRIHCLR